jgi:mRNA interferase MazF
MEKEDTKSFKKWGFRKEMINSRHDNRTYHERDIWWCSLGCNIGHEEDGKHEYFERPVVIFRKFGNKTFWAIPLSSQTSREKSNYEYSFNSNNGQQTACISQLRLLSSKRLLRYIGTVPYQDFQIIRQYTNNLI